MLAGSPAPDRFSIAEVLAHLSHSEGHCYRMRVDRFLEEENPAVINSPAPPTCFRCPKCSTPMLIVESFSVTTAWQLSHSLTLPDHPSMPLSTARTSSPTAVVLSLLAVLPFNPPLTFANYPHRIASSDLLTLSPTSFTSPPSPTLRRTNREFQDGFHDNFALGIHHRY